MNVDELLAQESVDKKEKLYSVVQCGKSRQYLGEQLAIEQVQQFSPQEVEKYFNRYETQLGTRMVKSIGKTVLSLYIKLVSRVAPIDSEDDFTYDLMHDPVVARGLETVACDLYYRFGTMLAPLFTGLITLNHIHGESGESTRTSEEQSTRTSEEQSTRSCEEQSTRTCEEQSSEQSN